MRFVVIGDTTLDITARDAAAAPGTDHQARITVGPGGQGANVAVRLARQGAAVRLITSLGSDVVGQQLEALLAAEGVEVQNLVVERSGSVVSLVDGSGERAMLSDRVSHDPGAWTTDQPVLADADWIHVSGYPLADPVGGAPLADLLGSRRADQRGSVGGGSFPPGVPIEERMRRARPDVLLFDRGEGLVALNLSGSDAGGMDSLATALSARYDAAVVVTDGPNPVVAATADGSQVHAFPQPISGPAVDATGAADAFAAGIIGTLAGGSWPPSRTRLGKALADGIRLGAEAASAVGAQARLPSEASA